MEREGMANTFTQVNTFEKSNNPLFFFQIVDCDKGSYGVNCNSTCGHCRDLNHCFHVDGICLTGCDAGYIGELCEKSRLKSLNKMKKNHCIY